MVTIAEDELEQLKQDVALAEVCRRRGIALKGQGADLVGCCPFHDDHEPSLVITPSKNLWRCIGACHKGGDVIAFVMAYEKVSFCHAVDLLRREGGTAPRPAILTTRAGKQHPVLIEPGIEPSEAALLAHVAEYYHQTLKNTAKGRAYLQARGILAPEAVDAFKLGFSNRTLGYRVPGDTQFGQNLREKLQRIGILRESGHEHFNGCVVFPIFDAAGAVA
jgi:DNA primase